MRDLCRACSDLAFVVLLLALSAASVQAMDLSKMGWRLQRGTPSNTITAILQTTSGYIWLGTYDGLVRYDGVEFVPMDRSTRSRWHDEGVTSLYEAPDGVLWIGHSRGGVSSYVNGTFTYHPPPPSDRFDKVQALATDETGRAWALTSGGLLWCVNDGAELPVRSPDGGQFLSMTRLANGHIWLTRAYHLFELEAGRLHEVQWGKERAPGRPKMQCVVARAGGGVWIVTDNVLYERTAGGSIEVIAHLTMPLAAISSVVETEGGLILIGTPNEGILVIERKNPAVQRIFSLKTGWVTDCALALFRDREGGIWLGTAGKGLFKLRMTSVETLLPPDRWQGRAVLTVSPDSGGGFWIGTEGAGLYHLDQHRQWSAYDASVGMQNPYVWSVYQDRRGSVWIGSWTGLDVLRNGRIRPAPASDELPSPINTIVAARDGGLWIGGMRGIVHYDNGRLRRLEPEGRQTLIHVKSILEEADGTLWVGCDGEGLGRIRGGRVVRYTTHDGLSSDYIKGLYRDQDGTLWIGTEGGGIDRYKDGRFSSVGPANGMSNATVSQIEDDGRGFLWMSTRAGIIRVGKRELNACADGKLGQVDCLNYGLNDGLGSLICSSSQQGGDCRTVEGRLVFSMDQSLAEVDPSEVRVNDYVPPVVVEAVRVDGRLVTPEGPVVRPVVVPPGRHRIEFKFTGLSFAEPSLVHFEVRLDGLEREWQKAGTKRKAEYSYVPPGRYRFQVLAANNDNVWNRTGATVAVIVEPFIWQTLWFRMTAAAFLLLFTTAIVWNRARVKLLHNLERLKLERTIDVERTRIANDMHDDLGAQLTRITMLCETARRDLADPAKTRESLARIYETARGVTKTMDEIVWAVNPKHDTLESLVNYFEKFAQDFLGAAGMRCRFDFPSGIPAWHPHSDIRHNLFLAYKEALNNVVRHSGATEVRIALELASEVGRLVVADNGAGLGPASPADDGRIASGNGIESMRRRLSVMGGSLEICRAPGVGFTVAFLFPWKSIPM